MLSEFSRDIAEERFQTQTFEPKSMGCSQFQGTHNPRLMNPSSVKYYSQEKAQNLDFDPQQTKQPNAKKIPAKTQTIFIHLAYFFYHCIIDRNRKT